MARIFYYADTKTTGAGKNDLSFLLVPRSLERFFSLEENLCVCVYGLVFFPLHFSVLVLITDSTTHLGLLWPLFTKYVWHAPLKYMQRIPLKSYGSWHICLKTDFCPHLGARIQISAFFFTILAGSRSHTCTSNLASSQGCDSVVLCTSWGLACLTSVQEDSFHHHPGRNRPKAITDFIEGCPKWLFYGNFPFFFYDLWSHYKASCILHYCSYPWSILCYCRHGGEDAKTALKSLIVVPDMHFFPTGVASVVSPTASGS